MAACTDLGCDAGDTEQEEGPLETWDLRQPEHYFRYIYKAMLHTTNQNKAGSDWSHWPV